MSEHVSSSCQKGKAVKNVKESLEGNSHSAKRQTLGNIEFSCTEVAWKDTEALCSPSKQNC